MSRLLNQATARNQKPTVVSCFSSGHTSTNASRVASTATGSLRQPRQHESCRRPLVEPLRRGELQILETAQRHGLEGATHGGEQICQQRRHTAKTASTH